jgi:hypothetical protein
MKKAILTVILISTVAIVSCSKKSEVHRQLEQVESVLFCNFPDSAKSLLRGITPESAADSAYYNILKTQTDYMFCATAYDFKDIDYSINYYKNHFDAQKLSNAYYYKAMIDVDHDSLTQQTVMLLKEAEKLADETADNNLKNKISSALAYSNGYLGNHNEALKYAKKEYFYAKKLNNNRDIAYGLLRLSTCYKKINMKDSSEYCINECNKLVQYINNGDKAFVYCLLGESCMASSIDSAQKYFAASLKFKKGSTAFRYLMEIYFAKNDTATAMRYCDSALMMAWNKQKIEIYSQLAKKYYDSSDIENLRNITSKIADTYDELLLEDRNKFILEMQRKFDFEKQRIEYSKNVAICISAIVVLCAICVVLHLLRKHEKQTAIQKELEWENRNLQLLNDLFEAKRVITDYELHIKNLESEKPKSVEPSDEQEYINSKKHISEILETGQEIYHKIENNECIFTDKDNWVHCLFYCMYNDFPKVKDVLNRYRNLSTDEKIFVMVDESFGKKDNNVAIILNISPITVRTRRSKLKSKLA